MLKNLRIQPLITIIFAIISFLLIEVMKEHIIAGVFLPFVVSIYLYLINRLDGNVNTLKDCAILFVFMSFFVFFYYTMK